MSTGRGFRTFHILEFYSDILKHESNTVNAIGQGLHSASLRDRWHLEALSGQAPGLSLSDLARAVEMPPATVHRLLSILKRRGYVRQDDETARYRLNLKVLDLGFRLLGRSELKLYAYPVLRELTLRTGARCFIAAPAVGEVPYVWGTGPDDVAMHTAYGKEMPGHCQLYFDEAHAKRRLSCLRLVTPGDVAGITA